MILWFRNLGQVQLSDSTGLAKLIVYLHLATGQSDGFPSEF